MPETGVSGVVGFVAKVRTVVLWRRQATTQLYHLVFSRSFATKPAWCVSTDEERQGGRDTKTTG
jgi:hypothetical protein